MTRVSDAEAAAAANALVGPEIDTAATRAYQRPALLHGKHWALHDAPARWTAEGLRQDPDKSRPTGYLLMPNYLAPRVVDALLAQNAKHT